MKQLMCSDVGFVCDAVVTAETEDQVLAQAGPHAKEVHGVDVTPAMARQMAAKIRDV